MSSVMARLTGGAAAAALLVAPAVLIEAPAARQQAEPCYNGIVPGDPWATSCNFGPRPPKGSGLPDQAAVIACRDFPGCLSWYINGR